MVNTLPRSAGVAYGCARHRLVGSNMGDLAAQTMGLWSRDCDKRTFVDICWTGDTFRALQPGLHHCTRNP